VVRIDRVVVGLTGGACSDEDGGWAVGGAETSPESRTDGSSGRGPSIAHLFDSYFDRINDSILLRANQNLSTNY
jgi:hypothetical protein